MLNYKVALIGFLLVMVMVMASEPMGVLVAAVLHCMLVKGTVMVGSPAVDAQRRLLGEDFATEGVSVHVLLREQLLILHRSKVVL